VVYDDVKPRDYMVLVEKTGLDVIDRTMLILEIFEQHAGSLEAKLQIELARLRHRLPLVREMIRRAKLRELPGFLGPGGYAVDAYYRFMVSRIARIRRQLDELRARRMRERVKRRSAGLPHVAIVGYASAGKTTLFNRIARESKPVDSKYFTTVHPKVKAVGLGDGVRAAFVDTVGFIARVPPEIVEAFHATLEEITFSDAIVFVVDSTEEDTVVVRKVDEGVAILKRIGAVDKPLLVALNKIDLVSEEDVRRKLKLAREAIRTSYGGWVDAVAISAKEGLGVDELLWRLRTLLAATVKSTSSG
jgi:GTP-binding protein HflX